MKQQHIKSSDKKRKTIPTIIDNRRDAQSTEALISSNVPVRAIVYVEVGGMDQLRIQCLIQELNAMYQGARGGVHYILPVRNGKLGTDIIFEEQFLQVVKQTCEVSKDGEIVLQDGAKEVRILKEFIK
jgi:hypothetical protein